MLLARKYVNPSWERALYDSLPVVRQLAIRRADLGAKGIRIYQRMLKGTQPRGEDCRREATYGQLLQPPEPRSYVSATIEQGIRRGMTCGRLLDRRGRLV